MDTKYLAQKFVSDLQGLKSVEELRKFARYFPENTRGDDQFMGVAMGQVFKLAKTYADMPLTEIEKLLESPWHEARVGAVSIMDYQARDKSVPPTQKEDLFKLYLRRHDRINTWDLVDRSAIYVVGAYLYGKPRKPLYKLAQSKNMTERRTAIIATMYFIKKGDTKDTFKIAAMLISDPEDLIHKAVGWALRTAGGSELLDFLENHAAKMPRIMLRYAVEKLPKAQRQYYMNKKQDA